MFAISAGFWSVLLGAAFTLVTTRDRMRIGPMFGNMTVGPRAGVTATRQLDKILDEAPLPLVRTVSRPMMRVPQ